MSSCRVTISCHKKKTLRVNCHTDSGSSDGQQAPGHTLHTVYGKHILSLYLVGACFSYWRCVQTVMSAQTRSEVRVRSLLMYWVGLHVVTGLHFLSLVRVAGTLSYCSWVHIVSGAHARSDVLVAGMVSYWAGVQMVRLPHTRCCLRIICTGLLQETASRRQQH
jgi:hypothetical protein